MTVKIALVAAEPSGDLLGAALIDALKTHTDELQLSGIGGPKMIQAGMSSLYPMEKLSVMGLVEVLPHLPELLRIRRDLIKTLIAQKPDVFVGIDAPDFNLGISSQLKAAGIPTIQYVAPTVWAWKQGRVKTLRKVLDMVLSIYPFERQFLQQHQVPVSYVGHPLADQIPLETDQHTARAQLGLSQDSRVLALLPGSRVGEVCRLSEPFLLSAQQLQQQLPQLQVIAPMVNADIRQRFEKIASEKAPHLACKFFDGQADKVLEAADVVLTASGTATLQSLLYKKPMVVGYKLNALTYTLLKLFRRIKIPYVAMANLLAGEKLAPEFIQYQCKAINIVPELYRLLTDSEQRAQIHQRYKDIHISLQQNAADRAAIEVLRIISRKT